MLVETQPSGESSFQKLDVDNSFQKARKIRYYIFEVLSNFPVFLYIIPNILASNVWGNRFLALTWPSLFHTWVFGYFLSLQSISSIMM